MTNGPSKYVYYLCSGCAYLVDKPGTADYLCNFPAVVKERNPEDRTISSPGLYTNWAMCPFMKEEA